MKDSLTAMQHIQAPEDSEIRKRARGASSEPVCKYCDNTGVVVIGHNGATTGRIGCWSCGRGKDIMKRLKARERETVGGASVVVRRKRRE